MKIERDQCKEITIELKTEIGIIKPRAEACDTRYNELVTEHDECIAEFRDLNLEVADIKKDKAICETE